MSHCSSFDANPNDVTVLPTKSAAMDKGKADTISETIISKRKRGNKQRAAALSNETCQTAPRKKQRVTKPKTTTQVAYTVDTVLTTWDASTDYGISFRQLCNDDQKAEVQRLNKQTIKGHKDLVKQKVIDVKFKALVAEKMSAYLKESRAPLQTVFHAAPVIDRTRVMNPGFISVGEWVEVDGDITPGWNSEGGIAVIINVHDNFADVKYVLTKWVEKLVPLRRLTTIVMPHRGPRASLRKAKSAPLDNISATNSITTSKFRSMSDIQLLKYGLTEGLWKKKGWLFQQLLQEEGITDATKQRRKELCWKFYKSQMLYIEAVQDAKNDCSFDPRRSDHKTGKDGKFISVKKGTVKPKNALTVTYLCFAFDVPYATFKRWKIDSGVSAKAVPVNKGKSVITDHNWASKIYNPRRMFVLHSMGIWLQKHPAKKHDTAGKKVWLYK